MTEKIIVSNKGLVKADFNFWVGRYMDKFYDGLEQKKVIGNKCSKCGKVFCPPRQICGECKEILPLDQNWVDLPDTGILVNYTMTTYKISDRRDRKVKDLQIIGMVQIDGSNTAIVNRVLNLSPEEVKTGMKLEIEWSEKTTGAPSDINGFVKV
jgi:uncharacterized OB-fold protein